MDNQKVLIFSGDDNSHAIPLKEIKTVELVENQPKGYYIRVKINDSTYSYVVNFANREKAKYCFDRIVEECFQNSIKINYKDETSNFNCNCDYNCVTVKATYCQKFGIFRKANQFCKYSNVDDSCECCKHYKK